MEAFQYRRGLRVDGVCGRQTWDTLVEAGFRLGDRFLYRRTPMLRGDDVAELQQRLGALGFDAGRVDGIFGDATSAALGDFQRNAGLPVDGILGADHPARSSSGSRPATSRPSSSRPCGPGSGSARPPAPWPGATWPWARRAGWAPAVGALRRRLVAAGARVTALHHPDGSAQAGRGQRRPGSTSTWRSASTPTGPGAPPPTTPATATSPRAAAGWPSWSSSAVPVALGVAGPAASRGMSVPVLRETRMPAVIVEVGPAAAVVEQGAGPGRRAGRRARCDWAGSAWD